MLFADRKKRTRYPIFNNQYRYRGFDVGILCTEKHQIAYTDNWTRKIQFGSASAPLWSAICIQSVFYIYGHAD